MGSVGMSCHGRCRSRWTWACVSKRESKRWGEHDRQSSTRITEHSAPGTTLRGGWQPQESSSGGTGGDEHSTTSLSHGCGGRSQTEEVYVKDDATPREA